ncbi:selenocysteine-specific translation elongation factor [Desertibacillus haloalkaliphilus]|nr:selenocysteine-specific translation elongation factor [Desertibacillus haloalkaliphilus]
MAGHIDHGKTTLTKALTNIDTDRLKEEKERKISIELGYAPLVLRDDLEVSVIDVPGHERFIRQMIAGVAGIDLVLLVVAADEGVMPQTKEHLEILSYLGIESGLVVVTKIDRVDTELLELVEEDIREQVQGTFFEEEELLFVDSLAGKGIEDLKNAVVKQLESLPMRNQKGAFRLPIDQVFSVHGQGTVVRGTVYEGIVREGDMLNVLPQGKKVRARQLQVHHQPKKEATAGQRVAINLGGETDQVQRGDVLVSTDDYIRTTTIDIELHTVKRLTYRLKQRSFIKLHIGTAEVYGKVVFFDRNELGKNETILCQLRLDEPIVTKRGDRFILRRPTPVETIGGGMVIDPSGERYRFGEKTIHLLQRKKEGTPRDRVVDVISKNHAISLQEIIKQASIAREEAEEALKTLTDERKVLLLGHYYLLTDLRQSLLGEVESELINFHEQFPLRLGKNKAEIVQSLLTVVPQKVAEAMIEDAVTNQLLMKTGQFISLPNFRPHFPQQWAKRMEHIVSEIKVQQLQVESWDQLLKNQQVPADVGEELKHFLVSDKQIYQLDEKYFIHEKILNERLKWLYEQTSDSFSMQEAKAALDVSRKYLVPFLELLDHLQLTVRTESVREWKRANVEQWINEKEEN